MEAGVAGRWEWAPPHHLPNTMKTYEHLWETLRIQGNGGWRGGGRTVGLGTRSNPTPIAQGLASPTQDRHKILGRTVWGPTKVGCAPVRFMVASSLPLFTRFGFLLVQGPCLGPWLGPSGPHAGHTGRRLSGPCAAPAWRVRHLCKLLCCSSCLPTLWGPCLLCEGILSLCRDMLVRNLFADSLCGPCAGIGSSAVSFVRFCAECGSVRTSNI